MVRRVGGIKMKETAGDIPSEGETDGDVGQHRLGEQVLDGGNHGDEEEGWMGWWKNERMRGFRTQEKSRKTTNCIT